MWINAIRLAGWERSRCNEIYTGSLIGLREPKPHGWLGYEGGLKGGKFEGWLKARLPGDTEWRKVWTVLMKGTGAAPSKEMSKKVKRTSLLSFGKKSVEVPTIDELPGEGAFSTLAFYAVKPSKREQPLCIAQHRESPRSFVSLECSADFDLSRYQSTTPRPYTPNRRSSSRDRPSSRSKGLS
jgi:CCR4-NOT transcriptional complex subunit CAF120